MTRKERFLAALRHEQPDRVPMFDFPHHGQFCFYSASSAEVPSPMGTVFEMR